MDDRDWGSKIPLLSRDQIAAKVRELGGAISRDYEGKSPVVIGVLNGAFMFFSDLLREISIDCEVDFIKISSYGKAAISSGWIHLSKDVEANLSGRHVLVVEDIIDTGKSVEYIMERLMRLEPSSIRFVTLLLKEGSPKVPMEIRYVGFVIPKQFVVGYGLDLGQKYRNLPEIYNCD